MANGAAVRLSESETGIRFIAGIRKDAFQTLLGYDDPEIGISWPKLQGEYPGSASAEGYTLEDGTPLNLSDKDQKWAVLKETFHF